MFEVIFAFLGLYDHTRGAKGLFWGQGGQIGQKWSLLALKCIFVLSFQWIWVQNHKFTNMGFRSFFGPLNDCFPLDWYICYSFSYIQGFILVNCVHLFNRFLAITMNIFSGTPFSAVVVQLGLALSLTLKWDSSTTTHHYLELFRSVLEGNAQICYLGFLKDQKQTSSPLKYTKLNLIPYGGESQN